jgi:hypothetical protein
MADVANLLPTRILSDILDPYAAWKRSDASDADRQSLAKSELSNQDTERVDAIPATRFLVREA